ncbi:hypothetical protein LZC95_50045 [Pendulispora brunnea]|uniref:Uncharacterized protein n=1 Tax=Pendulispora brunnea TaxID=2905690 RepID=A0ABZ2K779_9BACT
MSTLSEPENEALVQSADGLDVTLACQRAHGELVRGGYLSRDAANRFTRMLFKEIAKGRRLRSLSIRLLQEIFAGCDDGRLPDGRCFVAHGPTTIAVRVPECVRELAKTRRFELPDEEKLLPLLQFARACWPAVVIEVSGRAMFRGTRHRAVICAIDQIERYMGYRPVKHLVVSEAGSDPTHTARRAATSQDSEI